ncbi:MAG: IS110 family transposase [Candidatus Tectomicrobia bacterium]|jgi:transposase|nr:IS110 family transposase [Candidatus Tectomicrobia bacterium]
MQVMHERCAGLDVHKKTVVACVLMPDGQGGWCQETRTVGTMTAELLALADWLLACGCTHVAIESTGDYWKPVFNILEGTCEVLLVNAQHVKAVPGRKTDVKDAAWLAELLQHGLLRASFIPPVAQRELRDLTRYRSTFIQERVTLINRVQKLLEDANIKLAAVAPDIMGVSGRAMLAALVAGHTDPHALADLAKGRLRSKREPLAKALEGRVKPHHRFVLTELLCQVDSLEETIARFDAQIQEICGPFDEAVGLLDTIPGVARHTAEMIVAEIGTDMTRFPSADHLTSWAGVAPGNYESAGKRASGKTRKGNRFLRTVLVQAAHAAARTKGTYLSAQYRRLSMRRGKKRAILAVAHSMLVMAYYMIQRHEPYREAGADFFDRLQPEDTARRLVKRLELLGYHVTLQNPSTDVIP